MMKKTAQSKIVYYDNILEDEFSEAKITPKKIDESYDYDGGKKRRIARKILYFLVKPPARLFMKIKFGHKIIGREILQEYRDQGYFMYGNHTNPIADALIPALVNLPQKCDVIVNPANISMPVLGRITPALGALPLPDNMKGMKNFTNALKIRMESKYCVMIYPEAHIWPYCTFIRPYKNSSFHYPVTFKVPVFTLTNTYQKRKFWKTPRLVTYIDGPFYPELSDASNSQKKESLRNQAYETMVQRSQNNTVQLITYLPRKEKV